MNKDSVIASVYCAGTGLIFGMAAGTALHNGVPPQVVLIVMIVIAGGIAWWRRAKES